MTELPALPLWNVLYLNGISLVLTGYLAALLDDSGTVGFRVDPASLLGLNSGNGACSGTAARQGPEAWDELPPLADPYAEI